LLGLAADGAPGLHAHDPAPIRHRVQALVARNGLPPFPTHGSSDALTLPLGGSVRSLVVASIAASIDRSVTTDSWWNRSRTVFVSLSRTITSHIHNTCWKRRSG